MIICEVISSTYGMEAIAEPWQDLHRRVGRDPFTDYDMVRAWWMTLGQQSGGLALHVVAAFQGQELLGVLPLVVARTGGMRVLKSATYYSERVCDALSIDDDVTALMWEAVMASRMFHFGVIRGVSAYHRVHGKLAANARRRDEPRFYRAMVSSASGQEWFQSLPGPFRRNMQRCARHLARAGKVEYKVHASDEAPDDVLASMIRLKQEWSTLNKRTGWIGQSGALAFCKEISAAAARQGRLFLATLSCADQTVAIHQGYTFGTTLYIEIITYDFIWSKLSPGHLIMLDTIRWAIDHGFKTIDLGPGSRMGQLAGDEVFRAKYATQMETCSEFSFAPHMLGRSMEQTYFRARALWRGCQNGHRYLGRLRRIAMQKLPVPKLLLPSRPLRRACSTRKQVASAPLPSGVPTRGLSPVVAAEDAISQPGALLQAATSSSRPLDLTCRLEVRSSSVKRIWSRAGTRTD